MGELADLVGLGAEVRFSKSYLAPSAHWGLVVR